MEHEETKKKVKEGYARIVTLGSSCCAPADSSCGATLSKKEISLLMGYSKEELSALPAGADLGLGCGNPVALASLKSGETVLDLGSGAGIDCFLASAKVGENGMVIGVDMTPEMIEKAKENARKSNISNVEFRLGEIENLPVADNSVDVAISNCVINLSPDKKKVIRELKRVLKPGGRIAISDIALLKELPEKVRKSIESYIGCVSGAILIEEYRKIIESADLTDIKITTKSISDCVDPDTKDPAGKAILDGLSAGESVKDCIASVYVEASKKLTDG